ncbi:uncharacterized protein EV420DRAFT_1652222 [Desarmillaria tabescens]|uniref:Uncharacterized protein n=1 Tax=Armillaria tabescens TaxID=1929756 RepID=A0AA39J8E2_ARMTA|nr:uncharacterized protein EV420DRAFT_1652222 [Desarmillaria tabescens]KAK0437096.1 hypothetical protein EV420DRAFT_1652222 [Desarmillaria tabescens]
MHKHKRMDEHYNRKDAGKALQQYIIDSMKTMTHHLAIKPQNKWLNKTTVISMDRERTWHMVQTDSDNQLEEVVFKLQGILVKKDLSPVTEVPIKENYAFLQQYVQIIRLGGDAFKDTADSIMEAQLIDLALDISNRYFETMKTHPQEQAEFEPGMDPKGILAAAGIKRNLIHMEDKKVWFYMSKVDENGERKFIMTEPQIFRIGDIVEVQLSIIAVLMKKLQRKLKLKLRMVAMINESFTKERARVMHKNAIMDKAEMKVRGNAADKQRTSLKCKVGY